ncbi:MaoC/PaaZ C-terminal domain-containing protein [Dermatophilus congolensis]|uniref:MaoC/PaaZ C-terminal domain-containing protein n=1 Tax=Dermatophilus congolensis TaxID=1863 RepID=UPI001AAE721F|nr:MaoC/PaaZ C-terminal domain-containing protein [Dermatophilus congolensis]MBO3143198.1 hypothetical protein [Dermatophilus congolensis]MBO3152184.1 hypothetical protein [Dermatophilus congolensis]MBO3160803.1 hypothetical protein [Dermatophilus congolensis]MBO3163472.1 hypothetical protein [Dermatophilus congolensis]MBO3177022.1 hypothetical protein [Dermatophilus congolensis]
MSGVLFESVRVGDELPGRVVSFSREDVVAYAAVSGDRNRIHWDDSYAREVGLPGVIAHGMFTMGSASSLVEDWVGARGFVSAYRAKFTDVVPVPYAGSVQVGVAGVVKSVDEQARSVVVELSASVDNRKVLGNVRVTVVFV